MATLYIVSTPIGNLEDITQRALRILSEVDLILCEDTRVTRKLLDRYGISVPLLSYHQHSDTGKIKHVIQLLEKGKDLALVSDAGTPGISDPGNKLIEETLPLKNLKIVPVPGASAAAAAASVSGFQMDRFLFLGFPPPKKKRKKFFEQVQSSVYPVIFYESPYRITKTLSELVPLIKNRQIAVCRELTKKFETIYRGKAEEVLAQIQKDVPRGEFTVVIEGK